jgi:hypothetical protein
MPVKSLISPLRAFLYSPFTSLVSQTSSLQKNADQLKNFLTLGARIFYADHHQAGDIPQHPHLTALINTSTDTCTSLIINQHLQVISNKIKWGGVAGHFLIKFIRCKM